MKSARSAPGLDMEISAASASTGTGQAQAPYADIPIFTLVGLGRIDASALIMGISALVSDAGLPVFAR